ncbi:MAG: hypothetical protein U9Q97_09320 [Acidobacteriota bacterium]|nr:hypothetical protein [Acidobacteriota bacterium]
MDSNLSRTAVLGSKKTIVDEWKDIKALFPTELKPVKIDSKVTALLILDIQNRNCNSERRPRCVASAASHIGPCLNMVIFKLDF